MFNRFFRAIFSKIEMRTTIPAASKYFVKAQAMTQPFSLPAKSAVVSTVNLTRRS